MIFFTGIKLKVYCKFQMFFVLRYLFIYVFMYLLILILCSEIFWGIYDHIRLVFVRRSENLLLFIRLAETT